MAQDRPIHDLALLTLTIGDLQRDYRQPDGRPYHRTTLIRWQNAARGEELEAITEAHIHAAGPRELSGTIADAVENLGDSLDSLQAAIQHTLTLSP